MRSVVIHCLRQFQHALLVSHCSFVCGTDHFLQLGTVSQNTVQKSLTSFSHSHDDRFEPVPSTSSESVDNRLSTQEGKQTSQESVSTCKGPRPNQAPVINIDCRGGSQARRY